MLNAELWTPDVPQVQEGVVQMAYFLVLAGWLAGWTGWAVCPGWAVCLVVVIYTDTCTDSQRHTEAHTDTLMD